MYAKGGVNIKRTCAYEGEGGQILANFVSQAAAGKASPYKISLPAVPYLPGKVELIQLSSGSYGTSNCLLAAP